MVNDVEKGGVNRSGRSKRAESCEPFIEVSLAKYDVETNHPRKGWENSTEVTTDYRQYGIRDKDGRTFIQAYVRNTGNRNRGVKRTDGRMPSDSGGGLSRSSDNTLPKQGVAKGLACLVLKRFYNLSN